jgi:ParB-like chromosome segregation protein Spo0J
MKRTKAKLSALKKESADQVWTIERVKPYGRNARKIPQAAIDKVARSIQEFGFRQRIVVDAKGVIAAGHTRWLAAKQLGLREVPVHIALELTAEQIRAYRLMDNRSHTESEWDIGLLGPELLDLKALDLDLSLTGFDSGELAQYMAQPTEETDAPSRSLSERFGVPPFSVLDARQGYWQDRKRAWLSLGIQSELGRGGAPGGSPRPAAQLTASGHTQRGDGRGRFIGVNA